VTCVIFLKKKIFPSTRCSDGTLLSGGKYIVYIFYIYSIHIPTDKGDHDQMHTAPGGSSSPLITSLQAWQTNKIRRQKEKEKKGVD